MEPAPAPVTAATGALKPVVAKLAALIGDEGLKGVHVDIQLLADELSAMDTFLLNMAEAEDPADDVQDKAWMDKVRELSYDMEDSIDDFIIVGGHKYVDNPDHGFVEKMKGQAGKDFKEEIIGFLGKVEDLSGAMKAPRQASGDLKEEIVEVTHAAVDPAALAMFELLSKRDEPAKAELLKLLTQDEDEGCELLLAEVAGGCGTSLAEVDQGFELLQVEEDGCDLTEEQEQQQEEQETEDGCDQSPLAEEDQGSELLRVEEGGCDLAAEEQQQEEEQETEDGCDQSPLAEEDDGCDSPLAEEEDGCGSPLAEEDEEDNGCESQTRKQPKVVTIVGAGGTDLANQVYEELRVKFDYWSFISLSPNPELTGILTILLLEFTGQFKEIGSLQQLIDEIKDFLLEKR
uniref:Uncharacterized protein n=1 Tax=Avena sativa TaxID=4498 RepID=A0ACD5YY19_AVESA